MSPKQFYDLLVYKSANDEFPSILYDENDNNPTPSVQGENNRFDPIGLLLPSGYEFTNIDLLDIINLIGSEWMPEWMDQSDAIQLQIIHDVHAVEWFADGSSSKLWDHQSFVKEINQLKCFSPQLIGK